MTEQELAALIELLNRTPITQAERLWVQALVAREMQRITDKKQQEQQ